MNILLKDLRRKPYFAEKAKSGETHYISYGRKSSLRAGQIRPEYLITHSNQIDSFVKLFSILAVLDHPAACHDQHGFQRFHYDPRL
jgi:hypothetical protein